MFLKMSLLYPVAYITKVGQNFGLGKMHLLNICKNIIY